MTTPDDLRAAARRARAEATELRTLAAGLDHSHVHELTRLGGDSTWVGPSASLFQAAVDRGRQEIGWAAADLRRAGTLLDQEASDLDRAAARAALAAAV